MTDSCRKGKRTELELVAALRPFFPEARRNLEQGLHLRLIGQVASNRAWMAHRIAHRAGLCGEGADEAT